MDDAFSLHPKFCRAGVAAKGWWLDALAHCNRGLTDGFITTQDVLFVSPFTPPAQTLELVEILVRERLLERRDDGFVMHDYLDYQLSREEAQELRESRIEWGRKGGRNSGKSRRERAKHQLEAPLEAEPSQKSKHAGNPHRTSPHLTSPPVVSDPSTTPLESKNTALSGSRPTPNGFPGQAREILEWLNGKAGKRFEFIDTNLKPIEARLREGRACWQLKKMVSVKSKAWGTDEKMREFLRPATLFNKTKCAQYIGELPAATPNGEAE